MTDNKTTEQKPIHILSLTVENVQRVEAVHIETKGDSVVIGGMNAQGKSSVLDAIEYAIDGGRSFSEMPVRKGENKARIIIETSELKIERTWKNGKSKLLLTSPNGTIQTPQRLLDAMKGELTFDPIEFVNDKPPVQKKKLQKVLGIDVDDMEAKRKEIYQTRTEVGRNLKQQEGVLSGYGVEAGDDKLERLDSDKLLQELKDASAHNDRRSDLEREANLHRVQIDNGKRDLAEEKGAYERQVKRMNEEHEARLLEARKAYDAEVEKLQGEIGSEEAKHAHACKQFNDMKVIDVLPLEDKLSKASETNTRVANYESYVTTKSSVKTHEEHYQKLTDDIEAIDQAKEDTLANAEYPVEGLSFDEDGLIFNGIPFDQASQAEKLGVAIAMCVAEKPRLRIALIRDGAYMDPNHLAKALKVAKAHDVQLWIERVGEGDECQVIIEDGKVKDVDPDAHQNAMDHIDEVEADVQQMEYEQQMNDEMQREIEDTYE